ncbi:MAG: AbrB/MazE/SpoVT family DNA-binding domain-containing protein [Bryobacteraceae bacterium]
MQEVLQHAARITSKGQITIPRKIRQALGVKSGDQLVFEKNGNDIRVRPLRTGNVFEKYRGIGNPGIPSGRRGVVRWVRDLRGR